MTTNHNGILWISVIALQLCVTAVAAQSLNDTLKEIHVTGKHNASADTKINEFSPGQKVKTIDSAMLQQYQLQSMANMLAQQTPVFIKSYGFNGLATLNFRGSSAAQSAVLWDGVPIQNAAMGIADVSTLPIMLMNNVHVVYGGSAALWGSGNVGGALLLEQEKPSFDSGQKTLSVSAGTGSYDQYLGGLRASISGKRWYCSANVFAQTATNNFLFTNQAGMKETMPNDHLQSASGLMQLAYELNTQNVISLSAWYQQYERQAPPALFETSSDKTQKDGSLRLLANWNRQTDKNTWYAKSSLIRDEVRYRDDALQIASQNDVYQYYQEIGWSRKMHQHGQLLLFAPVQLSWMPQQGSSDSQRQNKIAIAGAYNVSVFNGRMNMAINAREEVTNGRATLLPGADASFAVIHSLTVRANVQRTYRVPTLNELYYFPGGNAGLKPEQGWNEDAGYTFKPRRGRIIFYHDLSVFNRDIHDWIIWLGGATWTPHNIAEVHSRGVETENDIAFKAGNWEFHAGANTAYILATTVTSYIYNDGSVGKQIPYAPRYNGQVNIGATYKRLSLNYNHTYTGYRFITTDESAYLPPYQTGNVQLMYRTSLGDHNLRLTGQCNNIWNQQYQVVGFRPMPGINWLFGCQFRVM